MLRLRWAAALVALTLSASCQRTPAASPAGPCVPESDAELCASLHTGQCRPSEATDRCGKPRLLACDTCPEGTACAEDGRCECLESDSAMCVRLHAECGSLTGLDACGLARSVDCGGCPEHGVCGSGARRNACMSCQPEADDALCAGAGAACGTVVAVDRCGRERVAVCASCPQGQTCGANVANQCGPQICENGFCWVNPLPQGNTLNAVWASSATEVWAAGSGGTVLRGAPDGWRKDYFYIPWHDDVRAMWASAANDVWVVADRGTIAHWDGSTWKRVASPVGLDFTAISGVAANDIRASAGGASGAIVRWDGSAWSVEAQSEFEVKDVWMRSATEYYAVTLGLVHWNGAAFEQVEGLPWATGGITNVWGATSNDAWAWGAALYHFDGSSWIEVASPCSSAIKRVWGASADDVWAACSWGDTWGHWDGERWASKPGPGFAANALHGVSGSDVVAVGPYGRMSRFDGMRWNAIGSVIEGSDVNFSAVWASSAGSAWAVGNGRVIRWDGRIWRPTGVDLPDAIDVWGFSPNDVWVSGNHWDGTGWTSTVSPSSSNATRRIWGTSSSDLWGCTYSSRMAHWDGVGWTSTYGLMDEGCSDVHGLASDDVWGLFTSAAWHWNGHEWRSYPLDGISRGLWGAAPNDVWAAGYLFQSPDQSYSDVREQGILSHWDGARWKTWATLDRPLMGMCGRRPTDVYAVGGTIAHWTGNAWDLGYAWFGVALNACWVEPDGAVWAVGDGGTILRKAAQ